MPSAAHSPGARTHPGAAGTRLRAARSKIQRYRWSDASATRQATGTDDARAYALDSNEKWLPTAGLGGVLLQATDSDQQPRRRLPGDEVGITTLAFTRDSRLLIGGAKTASGLAVGMAGELNDAEERNSLWYWGALAGAGFQALLVGERAVQADRDSSQVKDLRAVALALAGSYGEAIADFRAALADADITDEVRTERAVWVASLERGGQSAGRPDFARAARTGNGYATNPSIGRRRNCPLRILPRRKA